MGVEPSPLWVNESEKTRRRSYEIIVVVVVVVVFCFISISEIRLVYRCCIVSHGLF